MKVRISEKNIIFRAPLEKLINRYPRIIDCVLEGWEMNADEENYIGWSKKDMEKLDKMLDKDYDLEQHKIDDFSDEQYKKYIIKKFTHAFKYIKSPGSSTG